MDVTFSVRPITWIVDFGASMTEAEAALYEAPFAHVAGACKAGSSATNRRQRSTAEINGGGTGETHSAVNVAGAGRSVALHRDTDPLPSTGCSSGSTRAYAPTINSSSSPATTIRPSAFCIAGFTKRGRCDWAPALEDRPRYTPTTTFETFPFPDGLSADIPAADYADDPRAVAIAEAARRLVELRDRWLNPPEWVEWLEEPVPGYPKRPVARDVAAAKELKARTLTNLYNARPRWLADAHAALDAAVAAAYGWDAGISKDDALRKLLLLNSIRACQ